MRGEQRERGVTSGQHGGTAGQFQIVTVLLKLVPLVAVIVIVVGLRTFLLTSTLGVGMRAASEDFDAARLLGVRANSVIRVALGAETTMLEPNTSIAFGPASVPIVLSKLKELGKLKKGDRIALLVDEG